MSNPVNQWYWAWVDPTDTTFSSAFYRYDEQVLSFTRDHQEGAKPELSVVIKNPGIGLLSPTRKQWAWLSWNNNGTVTPLFFGQLVGIPDNLFQKMLTLKLIARSLTYIADKQLAAEPLKVSPYYDEVFIDLTKRDDPDTVLEGYSALYHVDPVTLQTTVSDVLIGEDGTAVFQQSDAFFDSVQMKIGSQPLTAVAVDATVTWTQESIGYVDFGQNVFYSYSGDGFISDWPKPGAGLGAGWSCFTSLATDTWGVSKVMTASYSYSFQNQNKHPQDGDTMSVSTSVTQPIFNNPGVSDFSVATGYPNLAPYQSGVIRSLITIGLQDPFAIDPDTQQPAPVNIPASAFVTTNYVPMWQINASLVMRYDAKRPRSERLTFLLQAETQPVLVNPTVAQDSELIKKTGDVGAPIYNLLNWTSLANSAVSVGQLCFPNNPNFPGQQSTQICITAGIAGSTEPAFSAVAGIETVDNTVVWESLGDTPPPTTAPDWAKETNTPPGDLLIPRPPLYTEYADLLIPGQSQLVPVATSISYGQVIQTPDGGFQICNLSGLTAVWPIGSYPAFSDVWGTATEDGTVQWISLGDTLPSGAISYIAISGGETGLYLPSFDPTTGAQTSDGSVVWQSLGPVDIPAGGYPGNITARSYFPTERGLQSVEYLLALARARLRYRSRAITVSWDCRFELAMSLTCRWNALLYDFRLPGGQAAGKITRVTIKCDGDGELLGSVTIGASVGYGDVITTSPGEPTYVDEDYVGADYQIFTGVTVSIDAHENDVGYTPPNADPDLWDDGLQFPLSVQQVCTFAAVHGSGLVVPLGYSAAFPSQNTISDGQWSDLLADQVGTASTGGIRRSFAAAAAIYSTPLTGQYNYNLAPADVAQSLQLQERQLNAQAYSASIELQANPVWYDLQIKPVTNGPFAAEYGLTVTELTVPKTIDLEAHA